MKPTISILAALAALAAQAAAQTAVVAVNFEGKYNTAVQDGTSPFGIPAADWTNFANAASGSGSANGATVAWDAKSTWGDKGSSPATAEEYVYHGFLDDKSRFKDVGAQIDVSGLDSVFGAGTAYTITIYGFSDSSTNAGTPEYVLNPDSIDAENGIVGGTSAIGTVTEATAGGLTGNYLVTTFQNVTGDSFTVVGHNLNGNGTRETIAGFTVKAGSVPPPDHFDRPGHATYPSASLGAGLTSTFRVGAIDPAADDLVTITDADGLSIAATHGIDIAPSPDVVVGTYPLIDYDGAIGGDGFAGLALGSLPHITASLVDNTTDGSIDIEVTAVSDLYWDGNAGTSLWDTGATANWLVDGAGSPATFLKYDSVIFDDTATVPGGAITIDGTVEPRKIVFNNETSDYTLTGGAIASPSGLEKSGGGDLALATDCTFGAPSTVSGGTTTLGDGATGSFSGDIDVADETNLVFDLPDGAAYAGALSGSGTFSKAGAGVLTLKQRSSGFTGATSVDSGTLVLDAGRSFRDSPITVHDGATLVAEFNALISHNAALLVVAGGTLEVADGQTSNIGPGDNSTFVLESGAELVGANPHADWGSWTINRPFTITVVDSVPAPAVISAIGVGSPKNETMILDVADVSGLTGPDLVVSGTFGAPKTKSFGVTVRGGGTVEMQGANTYTGDTSVEEGTLSLAEASLEDTADVNLTTGATLDLQFDGADTIDELRIDGFVQEAGTWGAPGSSAEHETALITGTGTLDVTTGPGGTGEYANWAAGFPGLADTAPDLDFDGDGLATGLEWVLGGDPTIADAAAIAPTYDNATDPDDFLFVFRRTADSANDPGTTTTVEYGSDLLGWTPAEDGVNGIIIDEELDFFDPGIDRVTVAIPHALATSGKLFVRLKVTVQTAQ